MRIKNLMQKLIVLLFVILTGQLSAQLNPEKLKIGAIGGYAFYNQNDLKFINQETLNQLPFDAEIVDNFKPSFYFGAYIQYETLKRFYIGPAYEYHDTGSRLGARDYSGIFSFDQYVHKHQIGLKTDYSLTPPSNRIGLDAEMNAGVNFTNWKMDSNLEIGDDGEYSEQEIDKFRGFSWYVSPALNFSYRIFSQVFLTGNAAYSFELHKKYHYKNNKSLKVVKTPAWSGFKLSLGIEFHFK